MLGVVPVLGIELTNVRVCDGRDRELGKRGSVEKKKVNKQQREKKKTVTDDDTNTHLVMQWRCSGG